MEDGLAQESQWQRKHGFTRRTRKKKKEMCVNILGIWCSGNSAKLIWWLNFSPSTNNFSSKLYLVKVSVFLFWETFYFLSSTTLQREIKRFFPHYIFLIDSLWFRFYIQHESRFIKIPDGNKNTWGGKRQIKHTAVHKGANTISGRETFGQIEPASSPEKIREETIFPIKCQIC